jgi:hypothetical protein
MPFAVLIPPPASPRRLHGRLAATAAACAQVKRVGIVVIQVPMSDTCLSSLKALADMRAIYRSSLPANGTLPKFARAFAFLYGNIQNLIRVAGFDAGKVGLVAIIVNHLYVLYNIGRQVLGGGLHIAVKIIFAVNAYFGYLLAMGGNVAILINRTPGSFFSRSSTGEPSRTL